MAIYLRRLGLLQDENQLVAELAYEAPPGHNLRTIKACAQSGGFGAVC